MQDFFNFSYHNFVACQTTISPIYYADLMYIVSFFDRAGLYCSSKNLLETLGHVTPFCVITGMLANSELCRHCSEL